ncbi:hypothetical protein BC830DRAFT_86386 [Chytriomyces sp. MP71]|nr:hypothetical protein BC830DRAFT_86386 [Chytriomyces sp. MP71]
MSGMMRGFVKSVSGGLSGVVGGVLGETAGTVDPLTVGSGTGGWFTGADLGAGDGSNQGVAAMRLFDQVASMFGLDDLENCSADEDPDVKDNLPASVPVSEKVRCQWDGCGMSFDSRRQFMIHVASLHMENAGQAKTGVFIMK